VPLALRAALLNPGQPGDPAILSTLRRFNQQVLSFLPDEGPTEISRIKPTIANTFEVGYKGILADRLLLAADIWRSAFTDFVGPPRVETPSVFFDPASVQAFVTHRLGPVIAAGLVTPAQAAEIVANIAAIPIGTISTDQLASSDIMLTYRNFGDLNLWGTDLSFQFLATDRVGFTGSFSFASDDCFSFSGGATCSSALDIALNAPKLKGSVGTRWTDPVLGLATEGRVRFTDSFPVNSGVYIGTVDSYAVLDGNISYHLPWRSGATATLTVNNLLDTKHRQFVGAPELGRLAIVRLMYQF
jgi:iron complex outermembrane receptor protein